MPPSERRSQHLDLILLAAAALGAVLVLARQVAYGVGLHWDSGNYLGVARSLLAGAGFFQQYAGVPYTDWPPLYPLLLAVVSVGAQDPIDVAGPVNAALFGLTIFVIGQYLRRSLQSRFLSVWAALTIALAWPLANEAAIAMAEPAFILLVTLTLIRTEAFLAGGRTSSLVWAGVWAALAWQTRYVGGALLATVAVMLLLQRGARPAQRLWRAAGFALLAGAPMALWLMRNRLLAGHFGRRTGGHYSLPTVVSDTGELLWAMAASFDLPLVAWPAVAWLRLLLAATLAAAGGVLILGRRRMSSDWRPCYVFGGFALSYLTAVVIVISLTTSHGMEVRFLNPLYIPVLVTAAFALDRVLGFAPRMRRFWRRWKPRWSRRAPRAAAAVVTAALSFWTAGQIEPNVREIRQANSEGYRYDTPFWAGSATAEWIRRNPLEGLVLSNEPMAALVNNYAITFASYAHLRFTEEDMKEHLLRWLAYGMTYHIVWFDDPWLNRNHDYDRAAFAQVSGLELVVELADGAVFEATPAADSD